jgi:transcriptional regulator with XRE-family HTH domain
VSGYDALMNLVELAQRIKALRIERRMTLEQVASATGLTRSWLSKVENFRVTPSLPALGRIAEVLGISLAKLVEGLDQKPQLVLVRSHERKVVERDRPGSRIVYEALAHKRSGRMMDPFFLTVPSGVARQEALGHEGEEFLMVLEGNVDFEFGAQTYHLATGDSIYFDANVKHRLINPNRIPAKVLCVFSEPSSS